MLDIHIEVPRTSARFHPIEVRTLCGADNASPARWAAFDREDKLYFNIGGENETNIPTCEACILIEFQMKAEGANHERPIEESFDEDKLVGGTD